MKKNCKKIAKSWSRIYVLHSARVVQNYVKHNESNSNFTWVCFLYVVIKILGCFETFVLFLYSWSMNTTSTLYFLLFVYYFRDLEEYIDSKLPEVNKSFAIPTNEFDGKIYPSSDI